MVLGLKSKHKKGAPISFEYIVHVEEIRPWPPSEALKSVQTVLLQWENGDQNSGSFLSVAGDSNIVFNESFVLPLTLKRDKKTKDKFKKNYLEFSLVEPRIDKAKGKLIGTASVNLADFGVTEDTKSVDALINFKKSSNNVSQSALTISLEPVEIEGSNSSYIDNDDNESEFASITDDDASSHSSRTAGSFDTATTSPSRNDFVPTHKFSERSMTVVKKSSTSPLIISSPTSISFRETNARPSNFVASFSHEGSGNSKNRYVGEVSNQRFTPEAMSGGYHEKFGVNDSERKLIGKMIDEASRRQVPLPMRSDTLKPNRKALPAFPPASSNKARLKHVQSSVNGNGSLADIYSGGKPADLDIPNGSKKKGGIESKEQKNEVSEGKNEWKARIKILEEELKEVAAIEVGLYSVVAEHASSGNKVHAPARRISRFYTNACRSGSQGKRASAARAAVSGLVLVSRACGNDVPRLSFWLSNSIMLRAIVTQTAAELPNSNLENRNSKPINESDDMEDVLTFIMALEKVESWLFSRIVESLWWQTFTPHMQHSGSKTSSSSSTGLAGKKSGGKRNTFGYYEQGTLSMELWKKAFRDACEKLCPIRAVGHECGCLSVLVKLVMEQLVNRLDVAMFNAILRESAEEMPTDPVSDPITDPKVLPIPAGKCSFGAGAHLKNAIGNWSRWLSDLFGLEDESFETNDIYGDGKRPKPFKAFRLLHALSDLMMLPLGMLGDISTRKEVCPTFGPGIIKRVLNNFVPDEFSPDPIPKKIIDDLDTEILIFESSGIMKDSFTTFPCTASPTKYSPPPAALLTCEGEVGSQVLHSSRLSSLKKSYTSDDELDELDSPLTSIIPDSYQSSSALSKLSLMPKRKGGRDLVRYQLLHEIWRDYE